MIGRTLGHYRIVEEIGKGGMGVVYRAQDERLDRDVAVKLLPAGTLADEAARQRFRKEALALSRLNHPNIQTVHDFDTQDGLDFLVTEYVPGVTLIDRLAGKGLPEKEVLRLGQQLAEGLAAAHKQGIIHRDLKPSNLRVTPDGRLKILDFGVAKLLGPASATAATETATPTLAGTPLYMAPEQRRGEPVDARSDLYAAGLVLWEMATGKPPVAGRGLSGGASPELQRIVEKCLEEEPENRYQSARELTVDLRRFAQALAPPAPSPQAPAWGRIGSRWRVPLGSAWRVAVGLGVMAVVAAALLGLNVGGLRERLLGAGAPKIDSLAVLPLKNLMGDPEQDYFVEGMHEALTAELSKISALKVISRTSAMRYKATDKAMPQIAQELGVAGLIEGSVAREGDQVRITVQLIHGPSDQHLWAQSFDREVRGILALHSEVARAIAREVQVQLTPREEQQLARARPVHPPAHEAYLKGLYYFNKRPGEDWTKAERYFQEAIEKDPGYGAAYAGLAYVYSAMGTFHDFAPKDLLPKAKAAALQALEIDDTLAEAHAALADVKFLYDWDWRGAQKEFQRAIGLNPASARTHHLYAVNLSRLGQHQKARVHIQKARELDPLSVPISNDEAWVAYMARDYDRAVEQYLKTLEFEPSFAMANRELGWVYAHKGMYDKAIEVSERAADHSGDAYTLASLARIYALADQRGKANKLLKELLERRKRGYVSPIDFALVHMGLGEKDQAFAWLDKAYHDRAGRLCNIKVQPLFDDLRDDPRFQDLLRRMNFPEN